MNGKILISLFIFLSFVANSQIRLKQLQNAPDSTFVIGADTTGEPKWVKKPNGKTYKSNNPIIITPSDTIKINKSDGATNGYLSSVDWSIFNNKIDTVSITTDQAGYFITKNANKYTLNLPYTENNTSMRIGLDSKLGTNSVMIGNNAGSSAGFNNIGIGKDVLKLAGSTGSGGSNNIGLGAFTMPNLTSGIDNASLGASSLQALTTGGSNVAVGTASLIGITTGSDNTSVGRASSRVTTGSGNSVLGANAWFNGIGSNNTIVGSQAASNMDGSDNIYIGYQSGFNNDGSNNTSLGSGSMAFATNISNSVGIGSNAGRFLDRANSLIIHNSWQNTGLITGQFDNMRIGINRNVNSILSTLHVGGDVIVDTRSGQAISIAGYEANGRLGSITLGSNLSISSGQLNATVPSYSQGTGINITSGIITNIGDLSNSNEIQSPTVNGNTLTLNLGGGSTTIAKSGAATVGSVMKWDGTEWTFGSDLNNTYSQGSGISIVANQISNTGDLSNSNELQTTGVNAFKIANYTSGFNFGTGAEIINGAGLTRSQVTSTDGGSITLGIGTGAVTPSMLSQTYLTNEVDGSTSNEIQTVSLIGNTISLNLGGGSTTIAKSGSATTGKVLKWDGTEWVYGDDLNTTYTSGAGIVINGSNQISTTIVNTDNQTVSTSGAAGNVSISGGNSININVNDADADPLNERQTITANGNTLSLNLSGGTIAIAKSGSANSGSVLKWDGTDWVFGVDNTGSGIAEPTQQIVYGSGSSVTSESGFNYNPSTNRMSIGNTNALAPLHVGNGSSNPSTKAKILVSENVTVSGFAEHGFADGSNIANGESYNSYDARGVIASTINGVNGHYVSFQSVPVQNSGVTLKQYYGLYDGLTNSGTVTDYHVVSAVVPSGVQNYSGFYVSGNNNVTNSAIGFNINGLTSPTARGLYIGGLSGSTIARGIDITGLTGGSVRPIRTQVSSTFHPNEFNTSSSGNADMLMLSRGSVNSNEWMGIILGEAGGGATKYYSNRIASSYDAALRGDIIYFANQSGASGLGALTENARLKYDGTFNVSSGYQIGNTATLGNVLRGNGTSFVSAKLGPSDLSQQGATTGQSLTWNGSIWTPTTVSGTDSQTLSTSGAAGNVSISGGNSVTINVNDADFNPSNEIQTISKNGNSVSLNLGGGSFSLAQSGAATVGSVLEWDGTNWVYGTDDTGGSSLSGTTNYMAKFTSSSTIGNSNLQDNGSKMIYHIGGNVGSNVVLESDRNGWGGFAMYNSRYSNAGYGWEIGDIFASSSKTILADVFNQKVGIAIQPAYRLDVGALNDVDGIGMKRGAVEALMQVNNEGDFVIRNTTGHMSIGLNSGNISSVNPSASLHLFGSAGTSDANLVKLEKTGGFGSTAIRQYYTSGSNYGLLIGDGYSATTNYLGINHVNGELTVNNLSGSGTRIATASSTGALGVTGVGGGLSISGGFLQSIGITNFGKSGNTVFVSDNAGTKSLNISTNTPSAGMVLKWDGSQWIASTDLTGTTGAGCNCPFDGDTNPSNELQNLSYGTELDGAVPIFISNGSGISIAEGGGINLNRTSSTTMIVEAVSWSSIGSSFSSVAQGSTINWATSGQSVGSITWSGNNVTLPTGRRYTIDIVIQITNLSAGHKVGTIDLYKSGSFYDQYSVHTYTESGTLETNFVKCQFITDNGGTYTIRNGFNTPITGTVKSVIIKQL